MLRACSVVLAVQGAAGFAPAHGLAARALRQRTTRPRATVESEPEVDLPSPMTQKAEQNVFGLGLDALTNTAFSALHAFDDDGISDSSKNLRVLWARAVLHASGRLDDPIAYSMLPPTTRDAIVEAFKDGPLLDFAEFIETRTKFIDAAVDTFLTANAEVMDGKDVQVVMMGAGYDTRALRYAGKGARFFELDLPEVAISKGGAHQRWAATNEFDKTFLPHVVGFDLNDCGPRSVLDALEAAAGPSGLAFDRTVPTLFVWEAVMYYVNADPSEALFNELLGLGARAAAKQAAEAESNGVAVSADPEARPYAFCMVDSLRGGGVQTPFLADAKPFYEKDHATTLLSHTARWGGAVHFAVAVARDSPLEERMKAQVDAGALLEDSPLPKLSNSYTPKFTNSVERLKRPSYENAWYAACYSWQVDGDEQHKVAQRGDIDGTPPFATRMFGEPMVIYRDADGVATCARDVCPHRSAPMSMGAVKNGELRCFYHGWTYGKKGVCTGVPYATQAAGEPTQRASDAFCSKTKMDTLACHEEDGLVWVWKGNVLEADLDKVPRSARNDGETLTFDTVLDYNVDHCYVVENNLDSPHLFWLHDGSVPPIASLQFNREKIDKMALRPFSDDGGLGHVGKTPGARAKIVRFDPPNVVRHCGQSGFAEEFHIVPIAPGRCRVLLRQEIPKGPILTTLTSIPGVYPFVEKLIRLWNFHIGLEDYSVMAGQARNIDAFGASRLGRAALGDDIIARYYKWRSEAEENDGGTPYFSGWGNKSPGSKDPNMMAEASMGDDRRVVDGREVGTYGIRRSYTAGAPEAFYPPVANADYRWLLKLDEFAKGNTDRVVGLASVVAIAVAAFKFGPNEVPYSLVASAGDVVAGLSL